MSEYQYYEFQTVDQPLTGKQMEALRRYSSRAEITSSRFVNVYHFGNFKADPKKLVEKYFDAFLYLANWGTRQFMLRVPGKLLDPKTAAAYGAGGSLSCRAKGDHVLLSFESEEQESEWAEGEGWLTSLIPIRAELMRGDHRALYLGWLLAVQTEEVDADALEPTVPPGLGELDAPLALLAEFLRIDLDLITAAAEGSATRPDTLLSRKDIADWISTLPGKMKDTLLARLVADGDPHLVVELQQQALDAARGTASRFSAPRRSAADLLERAGVLGEVRRAKEATKLARAKARRERQAIAKRKKHLDSLVGRDDSLWDDVDQLIDTRQQARYDEAVSLLRDLRDLARMRADEGAFTTRMAQLHAEHARKPALMRRFREAKLID